MENALPQSFSLFSSAASPFFRHLLFRISAHTYTEKGKKGPLPHAHILQAVATFSSLSSPSRNP